MYGDSCANKFLVRLPNSALARDIRRVRHHLPVAGMEASTSQSSKSPLAQETSAVVELDQWKDYFNSPEPAVLDLEQPITSVLASRVSYSELRRLNRSSLVELSKKAHRPLTVYDELRRRNREGVQ